MKITKRQLRKLIKEELQMLLHEQEQQFAMTPTAMNLEIDQLLLGLQRFKDDPEVMDALAKGGLEGVLVVLRDKIMKGELPIPPENTGSDSIMEKELTKPEKKEKEKIVKGMKKDKKGFKQRYGDDAESVMYATATKIAKEKK